MKKENKQVNDFTKDELVAIIKQMETKLTEQQGILLF